MTYLEFNNSLQQPPNASLTFTEIIAACMEDGLTLTAHAKTRAAQRNIAYDEIHFVVRYGRYIRRTGIIFCQLLHKCIPEVVPANHHYRRLVGSTVVLCSCGDQVITVYRNERSFKSDVSKAKYRLREGVPCDTCSVPDDDDLCLLL